MRHHFVRTAWLTVCLASWVGVSSISDGSEETPPWNANPPIVTVKKELYRRHVRPRESVTASVDYVGAGPERREVQSEQTKSDVGDNVRARWSNDNGRTWTDFVTVQPSNNVDYGGVTVWEGEGCQVYDPAAGAGAVLAPADHRRWTVPLLQLLALLARPGPQLERAAAVSLRRRGSL